MAKGKLGTSGYKGPVHEAVRNSPLGALFGKQGGSKPPAARRPSTPPKLTPSAGPKEARVQEATTHLMGKGVRSYSDARSMAEYALGPKTVPAPPTIQGAMATLGVGKQTRMKSAPSKSKTRVTGAKKASRKATSAKKRK